MAELELLVAAGADAGRLAAVHAEGFEPSWPAAEIEALLRLDSVSGLLLRQPDGEVAGFVLVQLAGDEAEILTIVVRRAARRLHAGRRLLTAALLLAGAAGAARMLLEVAADNAAARALYASLGFLQVARRPAYYERHSGGRQDALVLARPLPLATDELAPGDRLS